jgi:hypothetical protein
MDEKPSDVTPNDLRAMRIRIGLDRHELAQLLKLNGRADIFEQLERGRKWTLYQNHRDVLVRLCTAFDEALDQALRSRTPDVFVVYPNDGVYRDFEPKLSGKLPFNSLHRMLIARWREAVTEHDIGPPQCVEIIPGKYAEWLAQIGASDSREAREKWCLNYAQVYKIKPGNPIAGAPET